MTISEPPYYKQLISWKSCKNLERVSRLVEFCPQKEYRLDIKQLKLRYGIKDLGIRRKRRLLNLMYDQSEQDYNIEKSSNDIELHSKDNIKLRIVFTRLMKLKKAPITGEL